MSQGWFVGVPEGTRYERRLYYTLKDARVGLSEWALFASSAVLSRDGSVEYTLGHVALALAESHKGDAGDAGDHFSTYIRRGQNTILQDRGASGFFDPLDPLLAHCWLLSGIVTLL